MSNTVRSKCVHVYVEKYSYYNRYRKVVRTVRVCSECNHKDIQKEEVNHDS